MVALLGGELRLGAHGSESVEPCGMRMCRAGHSAAAAEEAATDTVEREEQPAVAAVRSARSSGHAGVAREAACTDAAARGGRSKDEVCGELEVRGEHTRRPSAAAQLVAAPPARPLSGYDGNGTCGESLVAGLTYSRHGAAASDAPDTIQLMLDSQLAGFDWGAGTGGAGDTSRMERPWAGDSTVGSTMMRSSLLDTDVGVGGARAGAGELAGGGPGVQAGVPEGGAGERGCAADAAEQGVPCLVCLRSIRLPVG